VPAPALRTSKQVSTMAALGSLAAVLSILNMTIPFPLVPFLKFDFAEIPDILAFLLLGPTAGLFTTAIHALFLYFVVPPFSPVGPIMKFAAVISMMLGLWLGSILFGFMKRFSSSLGSRLFIVSVFTFGASSRVIIMSLLTFLLYYLLMPDMYLPLARELLGRLGMQFQSDISVALVVVLFTGVFNLLHVIMGLSSALVVLRVLTRVPQIATNGFWIYSRNRKSIS